MQIYMDLRDPTCMGTLIKIMIIIIQYQSFVPMMIKLPSNKNIVGSKLVDYVATENENVIYIYIYIY